MLSHYFLYALLGAFYYFWLASLAGVASVIAWWVFLVMLACLLLMGLAAPLSIFCQRIAYPIAAVCLLAVGGWAATLIPSVVRGEAPLAALCLALFPAGAGLFASVRSIVRPPSPRLAVPLPAKVALTAIAVLPAAYAVHLLSMFLLGLVNGRTHR